MDTAFQMGPPVQVDELSFNSSAVGYLLVRITQYVVSLQCCESVPHTVFYQDFRSFCQSCYLASIFFVAWGDPVPGLLECVLEFHEIPVMLPAYHILLFLKPV